MARDFPKPRLRPVADLRVPAAAPNRSPIGTAFDYLARFHLQRRYPFTTAWPWVAEGAHDLLAENGDDGLVFVTHGNIRSSGAICRNYASNKVRIAGEVETQVVNGNGALVLRRSENGTFSAA